MRQVIIGGKFDSLNNAATEYNWITGGESWHPTEALKQMLVSTAGILVNLHVKLDGSPGAGKTWTFTLMVNGSPSALTFDISDDDTEGSNTANDITVAAGNGISIRATSSGSPTARSATWSLIFRGDTKKESLFLGRTDAHKTQLRFLGIAGINTSTQDEDDLYQVIPTAGKIKNLYVEMINAPGSGSEAYRYTLRLNKANSALTVTITGAATTGNDTTHEITVAAGDTVGLYSEPLNSPANTTTAKIGMTFVADTDGESCLLGGQFPSPSSTVDNYTTITTSTQSFGATEINARQLVAQPCILKNLYVEIGKAPSAGDSWDITVRKNEVDTDLTVRIAGSTAVTGNNTSDSILFSAFDYVTMEITPTSSPDQTVNGMKWGMVMVVPSIFPDPSRSSSALVRVTGLVIHWSAGPNAVYQEEILTGGLFSQYFSPVSAQKEPEPTIPTTPQVITDPLPTVREYAFWMGTHTQAQQRAIFGTTLITLKVWQHWVLGQRAMGKEIL